MIKNNLVAYSVVVPHFEDFERLDRLLLSTPVYRKDVELIVVDDQSPSNDNLEALKRKWPGVKFISTNENSGAGMARNIGLDAAKGEWLIFADSDDEFLLDAFDIFDENVKKNDALVYFLAEAIQEVDGSPSVRSEAMNKLVLNYAEFPTSETCRQLQLGHVVPWAKVYSRSAVQELNIRFDTVLYSNDVAFNVLASLQLTPLRVVAKPVYRLYRRTGSLTSNVTASAFMERFLVNHSLAKRLAQIGIRKARPATGQMLLALGYGPKVAIKVWRLIAVILLILGSSKSLLTHYYFLKRF